MFADGIRNHPALDVTNADKTTSESGSPLSLGSLGFLAQIRYAICGLGDDRVSDMGDDMRSV